MGRSAQVGMAQKINLTMEFEIFYIKMQERGKEIYLDQTWGIPPDDAPRIHFWSSELKYTMLGKNFKWYENFYFFYYL